MEESTKPLLANYESPLYKIADSEGRVIVGTTPKMLELFKFLNYLADKDTPVLIRGPSGSGKELLARALHHNGTNGRKSNRFVKINCGGIPAGLLESELFGSEKGAYTGSVATKDGKFHLADGGTLFLDEIGDMPSELQVKLLTVLQDKEVLRVGGYAPKKVDVRVIAATHRNLEEMIEKNSFREDLYYRLNGYPLSVPSLNERSEEIPVISRYIVEKCLQSNKISGISGLSASAITKLASREWKGNIRELENTLSQSLLTKDCSGGKGELTAEDIVFEERKSQNVEMPKFRVFKNKSVPDKPWFSEGVLPIFYSNLLKLEGTKYTTTVRQKIEEAGIYKSTVGFGKTHFIVVYLTPSNINSLFSNTDTADYKRIYSEMIDGRFREIAEKPFILLTKRSMQNIKGFSHDNAVLEKKLNKAEAYHFSNGRFTLYAINRENVENLICSRIPSEVLGTLSRFNLLLNESYDRFILGPKPDRPIVSG